MNIKAFSKYLEGKYKGDIDLKYITNGFPLWLSTYTKNTKPTNLSQTVYNIANNKRELLAILDKYIDECNAGQIEPILYKPNYLLMIFCIPKKDGYKEYAKLRIIRNGSFHTDDTTAINDWISKKRCRMAFIPNLKKDAKLLVDKNYFAL